MSSNALLLFILVSCGSAVRAGCDFLQDADHKACPFIHRDGFPDGRCTGGDCCLAILGVGEIPSCSGDYEVKVFDEGGTWLWKWQSYGCCKDNPGNKAGFIIGFLVFVGIIGGYIIHRKKSLQTAASRTPVAPAQAFAPPAQAWQAPGPVQAQAVHVSMQHGIEMPIARPIARPMAGGTHSPAQHLTSNARFCTSCGFSIAGAMFCAQCGTRQFV